ncbi:MAG: AraC family transcriptional regulator [Pseudomonadota bacterium]
MPPAAALVRLRAEAERRCPVPVTIAEAQAIAGLNRNKINYGFKEMFGLSLQRYCNDLRMRHAADLLRTSALTVAEIAEIAESAGFSEPTNFTAAFRQHFGRLPSSVRLSARKDRAH